MSIKGTPYIFLYKLQKQIKMASNFPKLPGYVPTHDPTLVDHKKVSHIKLEQIRNAKNVEVPLHALPRQVEKIFLPEKTDMSKSLSHMQYPNHQGAKLNELFEPTFVKLDKQVSSHSKPLSMLQFLSETVKIACQAPTILEAFCQFGFSNANCHSFDRVRDSKAKAMRSSHLFSSVEPSWHLLFNFTDQVRIECLCSLQNHLRARYMLAVSAAILSHF